MSVPALPRRCRAGLAKRTGTSASPLARIAELPVPARAPGISTSKANSCPKKTRRCVYLIIQTGIFSLS